MKKLRITLNEKVYEVTVEVLEDDELSYPGANNIVEPVYPKAPIKTINPVEMVPAAPVHPKRPGGQNAGNFVFAPIVGTVTRILVEPGAVVKENDPLIILDAMKMDTYINAPRPGIVVSVDCQIGDSVHAGQKLIELK